MEISRCPACHMPIAEGESVLSSTALCPRCEAVPLRWFERPGADGSFPEGHRLPATRRRLWAAGMVGLAHDGRGVILDAPLGHERLCSLAKLSVNTQALVGQSVAALVSDLLRVSWAHRKMPFGRCLVCGLPSRLPHPSNSERCFGADDPVLWRAGVRRLR